MKNMMLSIFVILFTLACFILMYSFKVEELSVNVQRQERPLINTQPLNEKTEDGELLAGNDNTTQPQTVDNDEDDCGIEDEDDDDSAQEDLNEGSNYVTLSYDMTTSSLKYESAVNEVQNALTFKEKLYLIGIARYLDGRDFSLIRKYIVEGATQEELDGLWYQMRGKLPEDDYYKVYAIFLKYKR